MSGARERFERARAWVMWTRTRTLVCAAVILVGLPVLIVGGDWVVRVAQWYAAGPTVQAVPAATAPASPEATAPAPTSSSTEPVLGGGVAQAESGEQPTPVAPSAEIDAARLAAERFVTAWLAGATARDSSTWSATLTPLVVPDLAEAMPLTELSAIPTAPLEQVKVLLFAGDSTIARADLADGTQITISMVRPAQQWVVTDYSFTS